MFLLKTIYFVQFQFVIIIMIIVYIEHSKTSLFRIVIAGDQIIGVWNVLYHAKVAWNWNFNINI